MLVMKQLQVLLKKQSESGRPVREIVLERGVLTAEELDTILHPFEMTNPGIAGKELLEKKRHEQKAEEKN